MPRPRFTIHDAMILIAATAVGFAWTRSYALDYLFPMLARRGALPQRYQYVKILSVVPMLTAWSVGVFLCQVRRLRPPRRALLLQPGAVACGLATLAVVLETLLVLLVWGVDVTVPGWRGLFGREDRFSASYLIALHQPEAGLAVAGAWLLMAIVRIWKPEPSWLDRTGRALGAFWITAYLVEHCYLFCMVLYEVFL